MDGKSPIARRRIALAVGLLIPVAAVAFWVAPRSARTPAPKAAPVLAQAKAIVAPLPGNDAVAVLQQRLDAGAVKLDFDDASNHGYLNSVLKALGVPVASQSLVFAKNSVQMSYIAPDRPRALYFNDESYVGWIPGAPVLEVAAVDPKMGPMFYTLDQEESAQPRFKRQGEECTVCHDAMLTDKPIPRLLVLSVLPNTAGNAIRAFSMSTSDLSPFAERWGGWYVTGTHGRQYHMGNQTIRAAADGIDDVKGYIKQMNLQSGANVTDLASRLDVKPYLAPSSDIVALMILGHQTQVHNLITLASYEVREALESKGAQSPDLQKLIEEDGDLVVRAMLFGRAVPLTESVTGVSGFAESFAARGPRDSRGRSLRDLDLKTRLLRYPLSYLIYSESFDAMPAPVRDYVVQRLKDVLTGKYQSTDFAHLAAADRQAILEILKETKPGF